MLFSILLLLPIAVFGSPQIPDEFLIDGEIHSLRIYPLSQYLDTEYVKELINEHEQKIIRKPDEEYLVFCSGARRGYRATWQIKDKKLYLLKVLINPCDIHIGNKGIEFSGKDFLDREHDPVVADWYSGLIEVKENEKDILTKGKDGTSIIIGNVYDAYIYVILHGNLIKEFKHRVKTIYEL